MTIVEDATDGMVLVFCPGSQMQDISRLKIFSIF